MSSAAVTVPGPFPYWPTPPADIPDPLTTRDVLRYATMNGAKALRLDSKTGSLTPGKEADIVILDATAINVAPLNQVPGAVVSLMERSNVETVIVAGKVRKWGRASSSTSISLGCGASSSSRAPSLQRGRYLTGPVPPELGNRAEGAGDQRPRRELDRS